MDTVRRFAEDPGRLGEREAGAFYHLRDLRLVDQPCQGLACFAARGGAAVPESGPRVYCLGKCYASPASADRDPPVTIAVSARRPVLLGSAVTGPVCNLDQYRARGGGAGLARARALGAEAVIGEIEGSRLRGRGGAGFPTGRKWRAVAAQAAAPRYVVANADEGDPGSFSDRLLIEHDPFRLIEGMVIAARAVGAQRGYVYLRKEYPRAASILGAALAETRQAGWLDRDFDIELVVGEGSYLCGEETAMLNAIEGIRPMARLRPPQITERGLFGAPTLVNNVETLCAVPWIVEHGGAAYAALGFSRSRGTKLLSLNSLFRRPGLYEVEFGVTLRHIVDELGGGLRRGRLLGVMIGGPLAGLLPPALLDTPLGYEELQAVGGAVGHGGVIAFADDCRVVDIVAEVFRFGAYESCGKCVPCHRGTPELERVFAAAARGARGDRQRYAALVDALEQTSLCGHGRGLAEFARAIERHFPGELAACFA